MMIFLFFVLLLAFAESHKPVNKDSAQTTYRRVRSALKSNDIFELLGESTRVEDFYENKFDGPSIWTKGGYNNILEHNFELRNELNSMNMKFLRACSAYVVRHMNAYCELAAKRTEKMKLRDEPVIRESVAFLDGLDEHLFSMFAAFYDAGIEFDHLFEGALFLLSIDPNTNRKDLKLKLQNGCQLFAGHQKRSEITDFVELDSNLAKTKQNVTSLSNSFCTRWTPFISHLLIKNTATTDVYNESRFIHHIFHNEKCVIHFKRTRVAADGQHLRISDWNCDIVLASREYRVKKGKDRSEIDTAAVESSRSSSKKPITKYIEIGDIEFTLVALKNSIKLRSFYLNAVKYYNIAVDVMLFASIKEGTKVLNRIMRVVGKNGCKGENGNAVDELRALRSNLSAFKATFDLLVSTILEKKRINVTDNPRKKTFDKRVKKLLGLLDSGVNGRVTEFRGKCREIIPNVTIDDADLGDNPIVIDDYYFTESLLNFFLYNTKLYRECHRESSKEDVDEFASILMR